jgi:uncharacterized membrane protein YeaQ/YmgE (transglycosylase-associated protein family)
VTILAWLALGLLAGFIGNMIAAKRAQSLVADLAFGLIGAATGGLVFKSFGASGVTGLNLHSLFVSVIGAIIIQYLYHAVKGTPD